MTARLAAATAARLTSLSTVHLAANDALPQATAAVLASAQR